MEEDFELTRRTRIRVHGRVQGVGFRATARAEGRALGVTVDARNLEDGSVLIEAEGPDDAVEEFVAWVRVGPPAARVENVDVEDLADD